MYILIIFRIIYRKIATPNEDKKFYILFRDVIDIFINRQLLRKGIKYINIVVFDST